MAQKVELIKNGSEKTVGGLPAGTDRRVMKDTSENNADQYAIR